VAHIARHQVTKEEVEAVCHSDFIVFDGTKGRLILIGPTKTSRVLAVILDPEPETGVYYPVTARPADRKERQRYQLQDFRSNDSKGSKIGSLKMFVKGKGPDFQSIGRVNSRKSNCSTCGLSSV
jgi:uncharacterized DUF497 family protein